MSERTVSLAAGQEISRRRFMVWALLAAAGIAGVNALRIVFDYLTPPSTTGFGRVVTAGDVADFPAGSLTLIRQGRFFIVHGPDGLLALYQRCTHPGCLVPRNEALGHFACPCHAGHYRRVGEVLGGPPPRPWTCFR